MRWLLLIVPLVLSACLGGQPRRSEIRFDFGPPASEPAGDVGVMTVDLTTPSWLDSDAMQYRLLFADPTRRLDYAESRWVATPGELLRQTLEHRLAGSGDGRCRLAIDVAEFIQEFDTAQDSRFLLDIRATLSAGQDAVASRSFDEAVPAPTANAKGGVAAAALAVRQLGGDLAAWLAGYRGRCRGG